jgi:hypothetical protein
MKTIKRWWKVFLTLLLMFEFVIIIPLIITNSLQISPFLRLQIVPLIYLIGLFLFIKYKMEPDLKNNSDET